MAIQTRDVIHQAVPAEDMEQAFYYHHLVPAQDLMADITGRGWARVAANTLGDKPVQLPAGGTALVRFTLPLAMVKNQPHLELDEPPEGITIEKTEATTDGVTITLRADAAKVKAGLRSNLIVNAFNERAPQSRRQASTEPAAPHPLGTLPAVPFEIIAAGR